MRAKPSHKNSNQKWRNVQNTRAPIVQTRSTHEQRVCKQAGEVEVDLNWVSTDICLGAPIARWFLSQLSRKQMR